MSGGGSNINADQGQAMFNFGVTTAQSTPFVFASQTSAKPAGGTPRSPIETTSALEAKIQKLTSITEIALECANFCFPGTVFETYLFASHFEVGDEKVQFTIHTKLLEFQSPQFFNRVVKPVVLHGDSERTTSVEPISLPQIRSSTFRLFHSWIYQRELIPLSSQDQWQHGGVDRNDVRLVAESADPSSESEDLAESADPSSEIEDLELVLLYRFAVIFDIHELANLAVTTLMLQNEQNLRSTSKNAIQSVADMVSGDAQKRLHNALVAEAVASVRVGDISGSLHDFPRSYSDSVFKSVVAKASSRFIAGYVTGYRRQICLAHVHKTNEDRQACIKKLEGSKRRVSSAENHNLCRDVGLVDIGEEKLRFTVHKGLICQESSYFAGAFEGGFIETQRNRVELKEESVKVFSLFLVWLYTGVVPSPSLDDHIKYAGYQFQVTKELARLGDTQLTPGLQAPSLNDPRDAAKHDSGDGNEDEEDVLASLGIAARTQRSLVDLYTFADRRGIPNLKNDIMNFLAQMREDGCSFMSADPDVVAVAFSSLPSDSPLCHFLIDEAAWCWTEDLDGLENLDGFPSEFNAGLVRAMLRKAKHSHRAQPNWRTDLCHYHEHSATPAEKAQCRDELKYWYDRMANKDSRMAPVTVSK